MKPTSVPTPDRHELMQALRASGCAIDLDVALASPALARCLALTATAMREQHTLMTASYRPSDVDFLVLRLRKMVGDLDHQKLRAGPEGN